MKLIQIQELKEGMILERDVINDVGIIILGRDTVLSQSHISSLIRLNTEFVYVQDEPGDSSSSMLYMADLGKQYEHFITHFKDVYMSARLGRRIDISGIAKPLSDMVVTVVRNNDILSSMRDIKVNDIYTYRHCINVALLSAMLGKWSGMNKDEVMELTVAAVLHDVGKSMVPLNILNKPEKLLFDEMTEAKNHVLYSAKIISGIDGVTENIVTAVMHHHERNDGTGYPMGLHGDEICRYAKIIAIADTFDALTNDKVYQKKVTPYKAIEMILKESFGKLDEQLVGIFVKKISQFYVGNQVKLNNGATAEIVLINKHDLSRPLVKMANEAYLDLASNRGIEIVDVVGAKISI